MAVATYELARSSQTRFGTAPGFVRGAAPRTTRASSARAATARRASHAKVHPPRSRAALVAARRRAVTLAVVILLAVAALVIQSTAADSAAPVHMTPVVVLPGDTLWDIAVMHASPGESPHALAAEIAELNTVDPALLQPGTVLVVPTN